MLIWLRCYVVFTLLGELLIVVWSNKCSQERCAAVVSRCQLTDACECDMNVKKPDKCKCCNRCKQCLGDLFTKCCSCIGLCPTPSIEDYLLKSSTIEKINPEPSLWEWFISEPGVTEWSVHFYPVAPPLSQRSYHERGALNCSVLFVSSCLSYTQCREHCRATGAAKLRWFNSTGCCQCIGPTCTDYGFDQPICQQCPTTSTTLTTTPPPQSSSTLSGSTPAPQTSVSPSSSSSAVPDHRHSSFSSSSSSLSSRGVASSGATVESHKSEVVGDSDSETGIIDGVSESKVPALNETNQPVTTTL